MKWFAFLQPKMISEPHYGKYYLELGVRKWGQQPYNKRSDILLAHERNRAEIREKTKNVIFS